jgi:NADPH2:quinone reductase
MRAAVYRANGPAHEVLSVEEIEAVPPGPGEVRVRIALSAVNPTDYKERSRAGALGDLPFKVPDQDGAGTIEAVGEGVDPGRVGERVWLYFAAWQRQHGTAAEFCTLPAEQAVPLPDAASLELGASLGIPALTAHRCLTADGPVDGRIVLVAGGAGAVGHYAIQLARWMDAARVIATVSSAEKGELARAAGAHEVVDYRADDAADRVKAAAPDGVDRVVEVALHQNFDLDAEVTASDAAIAAYATGGVTEFDLGRIMSRNIVVRGVLVYTIPRPALREAVEHVSQAVAEGALTEMREHRFGLDRIADAHDAVEGGAVGKVFVDPAG